MYWKFRDIAGILWLAGNFLNRFYLPKRSTTGWTRHKINFKLGFLSSGLIASHKILSALLFIHK